MQQPVMPGRCRQMLMSSLERLAQFCLRYSQQARQEVQLAEQEVFGMRPYAQPGTVVDTGVRHQVNTRSLNKFSRIQLMDKWIKQLSLMCCTAPIGCGSTDSAAPSVVAGAASSSHPAVGQLVIVHELSACWVPLGQNRHGPVPLS